MRATRLVAGLVLLLGGCSKGAKPPSPCVSTGCSTVICGNADNCGHVCGAGSGCIPAAGHAIQQGTVTEGAGSASAAGGHAVEAGVIGPGAGAQAAAGGHSIAEATVSP
jgi:hypothetical protein